MIIADLNYLETVSDNTAIVGGAANKDKPNKPEKAPKKIVYNIYNIYNVSNSYVIATSDEGDIIAVANSAAISS